MSPSDPGSLALTPTNGCGCYCPSHHCSRQAFETAKRIEPGRGPAGEPQADRRHSRYGRQFDEAIVGCKKLADENPTFAPPHYGSRAFSLNSTLLPAIALDRKSTRLNSSHLGISYAVFCLK